LDAVYSSLKKYQFQNVPQDGYLISPISSDKNKDRTNTNTNTITNHPSNNTVYLTNANLSATSKTSSTNSNPNVYLSQPTLTTSQNPNTQASQTNQYSFSALLKTN
jgi:hypothetical protein